MGYRSSAVLAIKKEIILESVLLNNLPLFLQEAELTKYQNTYYYTFTEIKWYDGFSEIIGIHTYLNELEEEDYGLVVLGEDGAEVEQLGEPWEYGVNIHSYIETPYGEVM